MKNRRIWLVLLAGVLGVRCLTGCGKKKEDSAAGTSAAAPATPETPEGTWTLESMTVQGVTMTIDGDSGMSSVLELKSDGKYVLTETEGGESYTGEDVWTWQDGKGTLTSNGIVGNMTLEDGKLILVAKLDGGDTEGTMVFIRK